MTVDFGGTIEGKDRKEGREVFVWVLWSLSLRLVVDVSGPQDVVAVDVEHV